MKYLFTTVIICVSIICNAQNVFVQEYGLRVGSANLDSYYPIGTNNVIEIEGIGIVSPVKMPMSGRMTEVFVSGSEPPFSITINTINENGEYLPITTIAENVDISQDGMFKLILDPPFEFEQGDYFAFTLDPLTNEIPTSTAGLYLSHTIEWQYESGMALQIVPVLGTWLVIILGLLLCIISVSTVKNGQAKQVYS